jgi:hypothetical protein
MIRSRKSRLVPQIGLDHAQTIFQATVRTTGLRDSMKPHRGAAAKAPKHSMESARLIVPHFPLSPLFWAISLRERLRSGSIPQMSVSELLPLLDRTF